MTKEKIKCTYCKSNNYIKTGKRKTKSRKYIQRYRCLNCDRRFMNIDKSFRMRHSVKIIDKALKLRKTGLSYGQVSKKLNIPISRQSVMRWDKKFNK